MLDCLHIDVERSRPLNICLSWGLDGQNYLLVDGGVLALTMTIKLLALLMMWTSHLLIQPLYLQLHTYKDLSLDLVPNNLTIKYFRFLELFLTYMRILCCLNQIYFLLLGMRSKSTRLNSSHPTTSRMPSSA